MWVRARRRRIDVMPSTSQHLWARLAAAWAVLFALPHVYWATGRTEGLATSLNHRIVDDAGLTMAVTCGLIALFCLAGAATAIGAVRDWPPRWSRRIRVASVGLLWFGAVLLVLRSLDIYIEFGLGLTGISHIAADQHDEFVRLAQWFEFLWLPWFVLGAVAWTGLAISFTRKRLLPIG
jgi:Protein of unknown function (DUF3995)